MNQNCIKIFMRIFFSLQLSKSQAEFDCAKCLWIKKWTECPEMKLFLDYFIYEYLNKFNGWFEGRKINCPSTNNCLEATNNVIKKEDTFRNRLPIAQFFEVAILIASSWPKERNPEAKNHKVFALCP